MSAEKPPTISVDVIADLADRFRADLDFVAALDPVPSSVKHAAAIAAANLTCELMIKLLRDHYAHVEDLR